ncbi:MAG: DUF4011 domain-containing protein, partial [Sphingobacteriales bacterium]
MIGNQGNRSNHSISSELLPVELFPDFAQSFTYATFQHQIPIINNIKIKNNKNDPILNIRLELLSSTGLIKTKYWSIDRINANEEFTLNDRKIDLDAASLSHLNEAELIQLTLTLTTNDAVLAKIEFTIRALARDEWGGVEDMARILPAFVMPNDPAVTNVITKAAQILEKNGHSSALNGYQSKSTSRVKLMVESIYHSICNLKLHYAEPPASFESIGQKIRNPTTVANDGIATCLDSSLFFAAALEAAGLNPVVILFKGHAALGIWLVDKTLTNGTSPDPTEIRKAIALKEFLILESNCVTQRPKLPFSQASTISLIRIEESQREKFIAAVDINRLRSSGIRPLPNGINNKDVDQNVIENEHLENNVLSSEHEEYPAFSVEVKPTSPIGRIERWQRKLLDLTLRNRLLNLPEKGKTVPFLCTDISRLEDKLAIGSSIRLISIPEQNPLGDRDSKLHQEIRGQDINFEFVKNALDRDELSSYLEPKTLDARLTDLYRQAKNDLSESGANTLFLAFGFIRWKKSVSDSKSYKAPLL